MRTDSVRTGGSHCSHEKHSSCIDLFCYTMRATSGSREDPLFDNMWHSRTGTLEKQSDAVPRTTGCFTWVVVSNCLPHIPSRLTSPCPPHLHRAIAARRGDAPAIRRPRHRIHKTRMPAIGEDVAPIRGIPHLHRLIIAPEAMRLSSKCPHLRIAVHHLR